MIIEIILLVLAIPAGFLLAWMAKDELKAGREWFWALIFISIFLSSMFLYYEIIYASLTCLFIAIVSLISLFKGRKRKG